MKYAIATISAALLLIIPMQLEAQQQQPQQRAHAQSSFGVKGGVNFANLSSDQDFDSRTGLVLGVYTTFRMPDFAFTLQPELLYSQKGAELSASAPGIDATATMRLDYIELPVLAMFNPPLLDGLINPFLYVGPYVAYLINAEMAADINGETDAEDISDEISDLDFGISVGAGSFFGLGGMNMKLDFRYSWGLVDINDTEIQGVEDNNHRVFSITLGIAF